MSSVENKNNNRLKKKAIKMRCSCISVLTLLVSMLAITNPELTEKDLKVFIKSDCNSVANYIESNFDLFVKKFNESCNEDTFYASYIEKKFPIIIDEAGTKYDGVFLDFDSNNGYAIVANEYNFYDFAIFGDSPYKEIESESYCFSTISGYLYLKDNEYLNVDDSKNCSKNYFDELTFGSTYKSQTESGCGHITKTKDYVEDRYGSGWSLIKSKSLSMATGYYSTQFGLSCYYDYEYQKDKLYYSTEGNCWFVSAYNVLQSLGSASGSYKNTVNKYKTDKTKPSMPKITDVQHYDAKSYEKSLYNKVYNDKGVNISGKVTSSSGNTHNKVELVHSDFPKLYIDVRKYVVEKFEKVNDGSIYNTATIINEVGKQYGYNFKAKGTVAAGLYGDSGITAIDKELPFVLCTAKVSNAGYGDHLMAGCGYEIYSKTSGWWIFKSTSYKYFYELRDGHSDKKIYFDLNAWTGFGGIVLLDYSISNY